ncbi:AraC family transcriptional regulator [Bisgaard Taxon 10/6]|uniref:AraC family transcriptional regulator n=1 Tax=Exercitatus varius TaxID=67857 RepID=UPI00294AC3CE|nr:AraC family transcriptional regulator [Exercitatus varius]MDG2956102.1 AraC family transcriptional regulator [Exercitatus varius]MDG2962113.1 AraC family transcriptional regulator [Exercitatus varius]MDG2965235.1 AraC family transcriptional regulator [Exercitatus varius]
MLATLIRRALSQSRSNEVELGMPTAIPELFIFHTTEDRHIVNQLQQSGICLILQGSKEVKVGNQRYQYQAGEFVCYTVDLPIITQYQANNGDYLDIRLFFDLPLMREIIDELHRQNFKFSPASKHKLVSTVSPELIRAFEWLMTLTERKQDIPVMLPIAKKAIYYYLLTGEQGGTLREIALQYGNGQRIAKAVEWLKNHYSEPFDPAWLAMEIGMSTSGFYAQFRQMTGISPLQYQKNLRLTQANSLIKSGSKNISEAAFAVGYDSLSQFSREYKRYFGHTARQDL